MKKGIEITLDLGAQEFGPRPTLTVEEKRERMRNMVKSLADLLGPPDGWPKGSLTPGKTEVHRELIAEKLDEIADVSEYWKKNRDKGRTPNAIRAAILILCEESIALSQMKERA